MTKFPDFTTELLLQIDLLNLSLVCKRLRSGTQAELFRKYTDAYLRKSFDPFLKRMIGQSELARSVKRVQLSEYSTLGTIDWRYWKYEEKGSAIVPEVKDLSERRDSDSDFDSDSDYEGEDSEDDGSERYKSMFEPESDEDSLAEVRLPIPGRPPRQYELSDGGGYRSFALGYERGGGLFYDTDDERFYGTDDEMDGYGAFAVTNDEIHVPDEAVVADPNDSGDPEDLPDSRAPSEHYGTMLIWRNAPCLKLGPISTRTSSLSTPIGPVRTS